MEPNLEGFNDFESRFEDKLSGLVLRLELAGRIIQAFPDAKLETDQFFVDLVLEGIGAQNVGETVNIPGTGPFKTLARKIGPNFGILYTLRSREGSEFVWEAFD